MQPETAFLTVNELLHAKLPDQREYLLLFANEAFCSKPTCNARSVAFRIEIETKMPLIFAASQVAWSDKNVEKLTGS